MRLSRLLAIITEILSKEHVSASELAQKFGVSQRTIFRDIHVIMDAGVPVISHRGIHGGFSLQDGYAHAQQFLEPEDAGSLLTAAHGVSAIFHQKESKDMMRHITKMVPQDKQSSLHRYSEQIVFDFLPFGYGERAKNMLDDINTALRLSRCITFTYKNLKGEKTQRTVEPISLVYKGVGWYLFAFCRERNDVRFFKVLRMQDVTVTSVPFTHKDISYYDTFGKNDPEQKTTRFVLRFSADAQSAVDEYFSDEMIYRQNDGSSTVAVEMPEDRWIYTFILGFGAQCEVLEPEYARERIRNEATFLYDLYSKDS